MNLRKELTNALTLRPIRKFLDHQHRRTIFYEAFARFRQNPRAGLRDETLLHQLIHGWDNESWSAWTEYLQACLLSCWDTGGPVLECGSGLSSLLMGVVLQERGGELHSLEHHPEWAARQRAFLERLDIRSVTLHQVPIIAYEGFDWYKPPLEKLPGAFRMVVCDGPPGCTRGGRSGMLPVMRERLGHGCKVFVDDVQRSAEAEMLALWARQEGRGFVTYGTEKPYGVLELA